MFLVPSTPKTSQFFSLASQFAMNCLEENLRAWVGRQQIELDGFLVCREDHWRCKDKPKCKCDLTAKVMANIDEQTWTLSPWPSSMITVWLAILFLWLSMWFCKQFLRDVLYNEWVVNLIKHSCNLNTISSYSSQNFLHIVCAHMQREQITAWK